MVTVVQQCGGGQQAGEDVERAQDEQQDGRQDGGEQSTAVGGVGHRTKRKGREGEDEATAEAAETGAARGEVEASSAEPGERASSKRQLERGVVEDMMEEDQVEDVEHAHKRGRHEQPWCVVTLDVDPRRDKSE